MWSQGAQGGAHSTKVWCPEVDTGDGNEGAHAGATVRSWKWVAGRHKGRPGEDAADALTYGKEYFHPSVPNWVSISWLASASSFGVTVSSVRP